MGAPLEPVTSGMLIIEDMAVCVGFLCAFIIPLRKTLRAVNQTSSVKDHKEIRKIQYLAFKTVILTAVAMLSSFFFITMTTVTGLKLVIGLDPVVNSLCMLMMLSYFPDEQYYQRYCIMCIYCCDRKQFLIERNEAKLQAGGGTRTAHDEDVEEPTMTEVTQTEVASQSDGSSKALSNTQSSIDTADQLAHTAAKIKTDGNATYGKVQGDDEQEP